MYMYYMYLYYMYLWYYIHTHSSAQEYKHRNRTIGKPLEPTNNEVGVADMGVANDSDEDDEEEDEMGVVTDIPSITIQEGDHRRPDSMSQSR